MRKKVPEKKERLDCKTAPENLIRESGRDHAAVEKEKNRGTPWRYNLWEARNCGDVGRG